MSNVNTTARSGSLLFLMYTSFK